MRLVKKLFPSKSSKCKHECSWYKQANIIFQPWPNVISNARNLMKVRKGKLKTWLQSDIEKSILEPWLIKLQQANACHDSKPKSVRDEIKTTSLHLQLKCIFSIHVKEMAQKDTAITWNYDWLASHSEKKKLTKTIVNFPSLFSPCICSDLICKGIKNISNFQ